MTGTAPARLAAAAILAAATAVPYAAGLWTAWELMFSRLPLPLGLLALAGAAVAPVQLVREIVSADRVERATGEEKIETLDRTRP